MRLRVDGSYRLGYPVQTGLRYSQYLQVEHGIPPSTPPPVPPPASPVPAPAPVPIPPSTVHLLPLPIPPPAPPPPPVPEVTYLSLTEACGVVITCLRQELGQYACKFW